MWLGVRSFDVVGMEIPVICTFLDVCIAYVLESTRMCAVYVCCVCVVRVACGACVCVVRVDGEKRACLCGMCVNVIVYVYVCMCVRV